MWKCKTCGEKVVLPSDDCPSNKHHTQLPTNLTRAAADQRALEDRYERSCQVNGTKRNEVTRLMKCERIVKKNLAVSINVHPEALVNFLHSPKIRYINLHDNLGAGAVLDYDRDLAATRLGVDTVLFGDDGKKLNFGAINLGSIGLYAYGASCVFLKSNAIRDRVSFLENNSFSYVTGRLPNMGISPPSDGERALWPTAPMLATVKYKVEFLTATRITRHALTDIVLYSNGNKKTDRFIEAQIFPPVSRETISKIYFSPSRYREIGNSSLVGKTAQHSRALLKYMTSYQNTFRNAVRAFLPQVTFKEIN
jgi:hypothetical protein